MEVTPGVEEGFVREWTPCSHILNLIPLRVQNGLFSNELHLTCVDAVTEYIALGTNLGLVYWYDRKKGNIQKLKCEASNSPITFVKIVSTVDYMVGAGNAAGQVTVFQIPKEHPDNIPDNFKPKVERKVERYTIGDLHKSEITAIEWSKNGMRLFSGDKNGVIIMTEIDFYMHLCKSVEIVNEGHEIVQLSYYGNALLVSSLYRSIVCERRRDDGGGGGAAGGAAAAWRVTQLGTRERKSLCRLGATWQYSYSAGGADGGEPRVYCARPGLRVWRADRQGTVLQTLLFKEAISNPLTIVELLNPGRGHGHGSDVEREWSLGALHVYRDQFLVTSDMERAALLVLDPRSLQATAITQHLRKILSVSVNKDEIFVLEGPRSLVRLAHAPEPAHARAAHVTEDPLGMMTKSLTTSLQNAVNTVRDLTHIDQTVPYISSVLEPISFVNPSKNDRDGTIPSGEECFELPPITRLPNDISDNVLESIINEFKDISSDAEEIRRVKSEELQRKLKLYNSIMERKCDEELIHSSRRSRKREGGSEGSTPRHATPVRTGDSLYTTTTMTTPCLMNISVYSDISQDNDELLEKQIEEKEKILAKMLNLESLSIYSPITEPERSDTPEFQPITDKSPEKKPIEKLENKQTVKVKDSKAIDLVPKVIKLPNNWNLENIKLDLKPKYSKNRVLSPDEHLDSEWEII